ncbi:MAG: type II toxin-antitoxin system RelE/ParE family toxin [Gammaproteobacteria bacterium SHHR-1]
MIKTFRHAGLQQFFETGSKAGIRPDHASRLKRLLGALDAAQSLEQLRLPGFDLHPLGGDLKGYWSIKVNANWRLMFCFTEGDVELLDYLDYH